jgi:DNA-binding transcriptional regulator/RsmH inhibitor MraZ
MAGGPQTCDGPNDYGRDLHAIDRKGRVNFPARHRHVGSRNGTLAFWLSLDPRGCVTVGDAQRFMEHVSSRAAQAPNVEGAGRVRRSMFPNPTRVEPDQRGRFLNSASVCTAAELEFQSRVLGVEDHSRALESTHV